QFIEPEVGDTGQHGALARDRIGHDHIESREAIADDDEQLVVVDGVDVAHFAATEQRQALDGGFVDGGNACGHWLTFSNTLMTKGRLTWPAPVCSKKARSVASD